MKKILLTLALLSCAATIQAQFVVSLNLTGSKPDLSSSSDISTHYRNYNYEAPTGPGEPPTLSGITDSVVNSQMDLMPDKYLALGGGLKLGYQIQGLQFGISGSFNWYYTHNDQDAARYMNNNINCDVRPLQIQAQNPDTVLLQEYTGWFKEYYTAFTIAPYVRYELVQAGDIALFLEANGFFTKINKPQHHDYLDWYYHEMHGTIDTSFTIENSTISYGALVVPGLSWQISPHCLVDLYFDCLALGYRYTKNTNVDVFDVYDYTSEPRVLSRRTTTTTVTEDTNIGFDLNAAPTASRNYSTWLRVGFSYTF